MSGSFFAPLKIELLTITAADFKLAESPGQNMHAVVNATLDDEQFMTDESRDVLMQLFTVGIALTDGENSADERMSANVTVRIVTSIEATDNAGELGEYQRASSISIAYGHARSCINGIVGLSEMGGIMIPAINPQELLRQLDAKRDEDDGVGS